MIHVLLLKLKEKANRGFTLVELIIVVAIIAVLSAVAAPQYLKYVEKSKISMDMDTAAAIKSAIVTLCADGVITGDDDDYVTWDVSTGLIGDGKPSVEGFSGTIPAARSNRAVDVVYSIDFNAEGVPIVTTSVDYNTWDDEI